MRNSFLLIIAVFLFFSCSHKKQLTYIHNTKEGDLNKIISNVENYIEVGDVLKIDVKTALAEVSAAYNNLQEDINYNKNQLILNGYKVENDSTINYPFLGKIKVVGITTN